MSTKTYTDYLFNYELECNQPNCPTLLEIGEADFFQTIGALNSIAPISTLELNLISGSEYSYEITFVDGREWSQGLFIIGNSFNDSEITFDVTSHFTFPSLEQMIKLRRSLDKLIRQYQITKFEVTRL